MMAEDNNTPDLDELVFFEDDAIADYREAEVDSTKIETGIDPTAQDIEDNYDDDEDLDTSDDVEDDELDEELDEDSVNTEDEDTDEEGTEDADEDSDVPDGEFTPYYNFMKENGLLALPEDFQFDGTAEGFEKAVQTSRDNMSNQAALAIWNQLPDDYKVILEHGLSGGNDINAVKEVISSQSKLEDLDIENESVQEGVLEAYLKRTTKYDDKRIARSIARLRASGDLEEEAESALNELKGIYKEERDELVQTQLKEKEENQKALQESYNSFTQVVEDMKLPETQKKRLVNSIWATGDYGDFKGVSYFNYVDHNIKNNPEHLAQLAELYLDYDPDKGFKSDKAVKKVKSEVTKSFRDSIDELSKTKSRTKSGKSRKANTKRSETEILEQILNQNN